MSFEDFRQSITREAAPAPQLSLALQGLWHDSRDDWEAAHAAVQRDECARDTAWVHAYLHRKEGDRSNAGYWYARAGRPLPDENVSLATEWESISRSLLEADKSPLAG